VVESNTHGANFGWSVKKSDFNSYTDLDYHQVSHIEGPLGLKFDHPQFVKQPPKRYSRMKLQSFFGAKIELLHLLGVAIVIIHEVRGQMSHGHFLGIETIEINHIWFKKGKNAARITGDNFAKWRFIDIYSWKNHRTITVGFLHFLGHCRLPPALPPWHCEPIAVIASKAAPSVAEWAVASARGSAAAGRREPDWFKGQFAGNPHFS